jgi:hypothetical protein
MFNQHCDHSAYALKSYFHLPFSVMFNQQFEIVTYLCVFSRDGGGEGEVCGGRRLHLCSDVAATSELLIGR